jgi:hypothetical protein
MAEVKGLTGPSRKLAGQNSIAFLITFHMVACGFSPAAAGLARYRAGN